MNYMEVQQRQLAISAFCRRDTELGKRLQTLKFVVAKPIDFWSFGSRIFKRKQRLEALRAIFEGGI